MGSRPSVRAPFLDFLLHSSSYLLLAHTRHPYVTDIDLKKTAKFFAQKFATGASVTKNPQGHDEIVVQGDVSGDIVEMIEDGVGPLKGIPSDNIVEVEEKKKKGGGD